MTHNPGFVWTDDSGVTWAIVRPVDPEDADRGYAVNYRGGLWVLDRAERQQALHQNRTELPSLCRPGNEWREKHRVNYKMLARRGHNLELVDRLELVLHQIRRKIDSPRQTTVDLTMDDPRYHQSRNRP